MSSNQKMLKIMSFVTVVAALAMAAWTGMSFMFANTSTGLLLALCVLVPAVLDAVLGVFGVGVANKPARGTGIYYIGLSWLALVLNVVAVIVYVLIGGMTWPSIANLVVIVVYFHFSRRVRFEAMR